MMQQKFKWIHTSIHPHGCIYNKEEARGHQMIYIFTMGKTSQVLMVCTFLYFRSLIYVHQTDPEMKYLVNSSTVKNGKNLCSLSHGELTYWDFAGLIFVRQPETIEPPTKLEQVHTNYPFWYTVSLECFTDFSWLKKKECVCQNYILWVAKSLLRSF